MPRKVKAATTTSDPAPSVIGIDVNQTNGKSMLVGYQEFEESGNDVPGFGMNSEQPLLDVADLAYDEIIKKYTAMVRYSWYELGDAAKQIKDRELWAQFPAPDGEPPFHSFDDYVSRRGQKASRTAIYRALQLREGLAEVPEEACKEMSQANAIWLLRLAKRLDPSKAFTPEIISAARVMLEKEFAEYCNEKLPGAAKEEAKENITFHNCDKSLAKIVSKAVDVAMWDAEADDRRDALERICSCYLDSPCEWEGFTKLSNQQAFAKANAKGKVKAEK